MTNEQRDADAISKAIAQFPERFSLIHAPNRMFRISRANSYVSGSGRVMLYTEILREEDGAWLSYCKGTVNELSQVIVENKNQVYEIFCGDCKINYDQTGPASICGHCGSSFIAVRLQEKPADPLENASGYREHSR